VRSCSPAVPIVPAGRRTPNVTAPVWQRRVRPPARRAIVADSVPSAALGLEKVPDSVYVVVTFTPRSGSVRSVPFALKLPSAATAAPAATSPPEQAARTVASISSLRSGSARRATTALPGPKCAFGGATSAPPPKLPAGAGTGAAGGGDAGGGGA
jgi:hypothetical protein